MKDTKYKSREYRSNAIYKEAGIDIQILAESLLPKGYAIRVTSCDKESENKFTPRYKYVATVKPDHNAPHFVLYSRTKLGVYAKVVEMLFTKPITPIL